MHTHIHKYKLFSLSERIYRLNWVFLSLLRDENTHLFQFSRMFAAEYPYTDYTKTYLPCKQGN